MIAQIIIGSIHNLYASAPPAQQVKVARHTSVFSRFSSLEYPGRRMEFDASRSTSQAAFASVQHTDLFFPQV